MLNVPEIARYRNIGVISLLLFCLGQCIEFLFLLPGGHDWSALCRWDCGWYQSIASEGYNLEPSADKHGGAANWAFFPVFPLVARALQTLSPWSLDLTLVITSKLFYLSGIFAFILFARSWQPQINPWIAGLIVVLSPYSIYGNAGYTEPLFLTLTCLSFYFLKQDRFVLSSVTGTLLAATRVVGGSFGFSYLFRMICHWKGSSDRTGMVLGLALIPAGLAAYMLYLYLLTGDALAFSHVQVAWNREIGNPLSGLLRLIKVFEKHTLAAISVATAIWAVIYLARARQYELMIFSLSATLVPLATGLVSLPRFVWWQAPVLFALTSLLNKYRWLLPVYLVIAVSFSYQVYDAWLSGGNWVI